MPTRRLLAVLVPVAAVSACLAAGPGGEASAPSGRLALRLVDAPRADVREVVVSLERASAHTADGWVEVLSKPVTVDLLTLQNGRSLPLGEVTLPEGDVDQLRLVLQDGGDHHVTLADGTRALLTVPSGEQSGIKLPGPFPVRACATQEVTLDFDALASLAAHPTGKGAWILRPVVKVQAAVQSPAPCEVADAGTPDAGDAGGAAPDAGAEDAGTPDEAPDAGSPDAGPMQ